MKKVIIILFFILNLFAEPATKEDIKDLIRNMDKRFDMMVTMMRENNRQIDKRLEQIDRRFADMKHYSDKRFEEMKHYSDKRFEAVDSKFTMLITILGFITTIMITGFGIIMNYLIKERQNIKKDIVLEVKEELNKKADIKIVDNIITIFEDIAKNNSEIAKVLEKHKIA
jgi:hypothetical protein